jgi:PKHD-type hydroxylase
MHCRTFQILDRAEVHQVVSSLSNGDLFIDGKKTASGRARDVKHNLQVDRTGADVTDRDQIVLAALRRNEDFQTFAFPRRTLLPFFSRYEPGMEYGSHVDHAIMGSATEPVRSDLAATIFLSDPGSYEGGELVLELPIGEQEIKLEAGEAVVYSATSLHRVAPVTKGVRLAAFTWIQSSVRDDRLRAVLTDLSAAVRKADKSGDNELALMLNKSYHNLLRYAVEL